MKSAILLAVLLAGLVAVNGNWEKDKVYTYKVETKTLKVLSDSSNEVAGLTSKMYLTLWLQSDDVLIGQITQAEFAKLNPDRYDEETQNYSNSDDQSFENYPLSKPFKIHLRNGVIQSLTIDESLSTYEVNLVKVIVSQFQVDTNGDVVNPLSEHQLSQGGNNNLFFKKMESLATGYCETNYDISPIPDYLVRSNSEWIPMPEMKDNDGEYIEIRKTRDSTYCGGKRNYLLDIAAVSKDFNREETKENDLYITESQRIIISGSLQRYTIQSASTVNKLMNRRQNTPVITEHVNFTLESVESTPRRFSQAFLQNSKEIGNLIYDFDTKMNEKYPTLWRACAGKRGLELTNVRGEERFTTTCWPWFMSPNGACQTEFGSDWIPTGKAKNCGFMKWGVQYECRKA